MKHTSCYLLFFSLDAKYASFALILFVTLLSEIKLELNTARFGAVASASDSLQKYYVNVSFNPINGRVVLLRVTMSLYQSKQPFQHCSVTGSFTYSFHPDSFTYSFHPDSFTYSFNPDLYKRTCSFHKRTKACVLSTYYCRFLTFHPGCIHAVDRCWHSGPFLRIIM